MFIYVDEAGNFLPSSSGGSFFSLVAALIVPEISHDQMLYEFLRVRDSWPDARIEYKGSGLTESQTREVISILAAHDALLEFRAVDMATHTPLTVGEFKRRQAEGVTKYLTPTHHPKLVAQLTEMREQTARMSDQLFVQFVLTVDLILSSLEIATLYFVQRIPAELGRFKWVIDRKDRTLTEMESLWTKLILPYGESYFATKPLRMLDGEDYSHFRRFDLDSSDPTSASHLEFVSKQFGTSRDLKATDPKKILGEDRDFANSEENLGIQLVDIAATTLRRALNGRLGQFGWERLGELMLIRPDNDSFIQLGTPEIPVSHKLTGHAAFVWRQLTARRRPMPVTR